MQKKIEAFYWKIVIRYFKLALKLRMLDFPAAMSKERLLV
jgi:hypothetical protein